MKHIISVLKTTRLWSLFFLLSLSFSGILLFSGENGGFLNAIPRDDAVFFGYGGPDDDAISPSAYSSAEETFDVDAPLAYYDTAFGSVYGNIALIRSRNGFEFYLVRGGDTVAGIAARYGLDAETIISANEGISELEEGKKIPIPDTSGTVYRVRKGDSLEEIARAFGTSPETIRLANAEYKKILESGNGFFIIPKNETPANLSSDLDKPENLPFLNGFFTLPAKGWNWGKLHPTNAIDIANVCGTPVYASAAGVVVEESSDGSWNGGYGNYILIEHENGTKTRYAHTGKNLVKVGDIVSRGTKIALMGNTGNTHGVNGCHIHFEVHGAQNPFAL